ncbi:hypothetical protein AMELA_G00154880, partial [Ameiurus melas]
MLLSALNKNIISIVDNNRLKKRIEIAQWCTLQPSGPHRDMEIRTIVAEPASRRRRRRR